MRYFSLIVVCTALWANPGSGQAQILYSVQDLGTLCADGFTVGQSINASGQITGTAYHSGSTSNIRVFRVAPGGQVTDPGANLGTLGGDNSYAGGINASGQVTGYSDISAAYAHAIRTSATGGVTTATEIGPAGGGSSVGYGINDLGRVAGYAYMTFGISIHHVFRTVPGGTIDSASDLGTLGGTNSMARAINAMGQVTGQSDVIGTTVTHAYRTTSTGTLATAEDLGTFGGTQSVGNDINSSGEVVGGAYLPGDAIVHAFRSSPNGQPLVLQDLGTLDGSSSSAFGINSSGVVVGAVDPYSNNSKAFVYDSQMHYLSDLVPAGWTILAANDINDAGQIVGYGQFQNGGVHALVLSPIPEPSSMGLTGLAGIWLIRRIASSRPNSR
jgi:probable HAF family extracellular repeat protein